MILNKSIAAVIVTFNPDIHELNKLIESIIGQVNKIIIVNNGNSLLNLIENIELNNKDNFIYHELNGNYGIGYAQNIGVKISKEVDCVFSLLLDQDSFIQAGMISNLIDGFYSDDILDKNIAAVGPQVIDIRSNKKFPFYSYSGFFRTKSEKEYKDGFIETDHLISSGTIVNNDIFILNDNNESLFLEYVDIEWCLRIREKGYKILYANNVELYHQLGDNRKSVLGVEIPIHKPERYFYVYRNSTYCLLKTNFPFSWKIYTLYRNFIFFFLLMIVSKDKLSIFKNIIKGIKSYREVKD